MDGGAVALGWLVFVGTLFVIVGGPIWVCVAWQRRYNRLHPKLGTPEADAILAARAVANKEAQEWVARTKAPHGYGQGPADAQERGGYAEGTAYNEVRSGYGQNIASARRAAANAALDVPIVAYDRWGNPHVTTKRNQAFAAVLTLIFMIAAFAWIFHGGYMHQDCTTTISSTGPIENQTTRDVTSCK